MLQEVFPATLPPEAAFLPQDPSQHAREHCHHAVGGCSGTPEQAGRTEWAHSTGRHLWAHPGRHSAAMPVFQWHNTRWACTQTQPEDLQNMAQTQNVLYFHNSLPSKAATKLDDLINNYLSFLCVMLPKFNSVCRTAIQEQINPNLWKATWSL